MRVERSTAHGDKLIALLNNRNLPAEDRPRVEAAAKKYREWVTALDEAQGTKSELLSKLVSLLNDYKLKIELDLVFDSPGNFLYRQNGQIKLANSILEEFLPRLFDLRLVPGLAQLPNIECRPSKCFSHLSFGSPTLALSSGGVFIKCKDQDFAVTREYKLSIAGTDEKPDEYHSRVAVSYFASEIKTNLDKTMFQEANATAGELKAGVPGARYILLCEWLDMSPIDTKLTPIDEVIVLRKAKRLSSNIRSRYSTADGRKQARQAYENYLRDHPLDLGCFERFVAHLNDAFPAAKQESESSILKRGYF